MPAPLCAGAVFVEAVRSGAERIPEQARLVRQNATDSVHQLRVTTRRLRSVLRSGRRLARKSAVARLREELRWLATLMGTARDAEVQAGRLDSLRSLDNGEVSTALAAEQHERYRVAHAGIVAALNSPRFVRLTDELAAWQVRPPFRELAYAPASSVYTGILAHEASRLRRLVAGTALDCPEGLHEVRKAAKRLRYSAEAAGAEVAGADKLASRAKRLQSALGAHRDAAECLSLLATAEPAGPSPAWTALCAAETASAEMALADYATITREWPGSGHLPRSQDRAKKGREH